MPFSTTSLSYEHLSVRCLLNFFIFLGADTLSQCIASAVRNRRRRRRRRRKKTSSVIDLDDFNLSSPTPASPLAALPSSSGGHARSLRFALFGALVHAPACSLFFGALDVRFPGKSWREVCWKLTADRATLAPALLFVALLWMRLPVSSLLLPEKEDESSSWNVPKSSSAAACLETLYEQGKKQNTTTKASSSKRELVAAAAEDALRRLPLAYGLSCLFWLPAHSLGFAAVPPRWRVLYVALASLVWNCVLAGISSSEPSSAATREEEQQRRRQRQQQGRAGASYPSSSPASSSSLPLFNKQRQTKKARWSDSAAATGD